MTMPSLKLLNLGVDGYAVALEVDLKDANPLESVPIAISAGLSPQDAIDRAELFLERCLLVVRGLVP